MALRGRLGVPVFDFFSFCLWMVGSGLREESV
jgi:hypothetical protein